MADASEKPVTKEPKPRYRWPWFLLAAVVLAVVLAVAWMSKEIERTRRLRQWNSPVSPTNSAPVRPPGG